MIKTRMDEHCAHQHYPRIRQGNYKSRIKVGCEPEWCQMLSDEAINATTTMESVHFFKPRKSQTQKGIIPVHVLHSIGWYPGCIIGARPCTLALS